jgi:hypothetical protein
VVVLRLVSWLFYQQYPKPSFYNFPSGKSVESKECRKKWINVIACKDFVPTTGHRVCSLHFRGWRKPT